MSQQTRKPEDYVVCTAAEGSCPLRDTCLRSKVHRETDYAVDTSNSILKVVNVWNPELKALTRECAMYSEAKTKNFARGFKHLFDNVPRGTYNEVLRQVQQAFTSERAYYYCKNGTYLTSPDEQQRIAAIFRKYGITDAPQYDSFEEVCDWS